MESAAGDCRADRRRSSNRAASCQSAACPPVSICGKGFPLHDCVILSSFPSVQSRGAMAGRRTRLAPPRRRSLERRLRSLVVVATGSIPCCWKERRNARSGQHRSSHRGPFRTGGRDPADGDVGPQRRFSPQVTRVEVHLADENGEKAIGDDKRCVMEARLGGLKPCAVSFQAASVTQAVDRDPGST